MKILITGARGFIGSNLWNYFRVREKVPTEYSLAMNLDVTDSMSIGEFIEEWDPDVIIHCAAKKVLRWCQEHPYETFVVNEVGTMNVCKHAVGRKMILLSTDMVFSGIDGGAHKTADIPRPDTNYGLSKMLAEYHTQQLPDYAICRSSAVYGWTQRDNFTMWLLKELQDKDVVLPVFDNYYNSPTYVINLCEMIEAVIQKNLKGVFHTAGPERLSKFQQAIKVCEVFGYDPQRILSQTLDIPKDYCLNTEETEKLLGMKFDDLETGLKRMKEEKDVKTSKDNITG